jgi:hypothetical protein
MSRPHCDVTLAKCYDDAFVNKLLLNHILLDR